RRVCIILEGDWTGKGMHQGRAPNPTPEVARLRRTSLFNTDSPRAHFSSFRHAFTHSRFAAPVWPCAPCAHSTLAILTSLTSFTSRLLPAPEVPYSPG